MTRPDWGWWPAVQVWRSWGVEHVFCVPWRIRVQIQESDTWFGLSNGIALHPIAWQIPDGVYRHKIALNAGYQSQSGVPRHWEIEEVPAVCYYLLFGSLHCWLQLAMVKLLSDRVVTCLLHLDVFVSALDVRFGRSNEIGFWVLVVLNVVLPIVVRITCTKLIRCHTS